MVWLTDKSPILQSDIPNKVETLFNQVYYDSGNAYLIPKGLITDNYTIPFGINKSKYDARPSHLHDIGCKFHQVILIDIPLHTLIDKYLYDVEDITVCKNIPIDKLKIIDISFNKCNSLLKLAMKDAGIPSRVYNLYRFAVNFNINWLFTGKDKIDLNKLYKENIIT